RNLDPALVAKRGLSALTYQLVKGRPEGRPLPDGEVSVEADLQVGLSMKHSEVLRRLREWGLPVEPHWQHCIGVEALIAFVNEWAERRRSLAFDTDGIVIKVDSY